MVGRRNRLSAEIERQAMKCLALLATERGWDSITVDAGRRTLIGELDFGNGDFNDDPDEMAKLSDELAEVLKISEPRSCGTSTCGRVPHLSRRRAGCGGGKA